MGSRKGEGALQEVRSVRLLPPAPATNWGSVFALPNTSWEPVMP